VSHKEIFCNISNVRLLKKQQKNITFDEYEFEIRSFGRALHCHPRKINGIKLH
jgi:hypothetical protein